MSYQDPDVVYAAIELDRTKGGLYRSENRGESWTKMSNTVSGGTGPHYYQELYTSPHKFDRLYLMNVQILTSEDGGKNFRTLEGARQETNCTIDNKKWFPITVSYLLKKYRIWKRDTAKQITREKVDQRKNSQSPQQQIC